MMEYVSTVIDANLKVLLNHHLSATHASNTVVSDTYVANEVIKQQQKNISNPISWWQDMVKKNDFSVMNVINKLPGNNHLSVTHSTSMVGSDTVMNVALNQL